MFLDDNSLVLISGSTRSGKSFLLVKLLEFVFLNDRLSKGNGLIFTGTKFTDQFKDIQENNIYDNCDDYKNIINNFLKFIKSKKNKKSTRYYIIFDEMLGDIKLQSDVMKHLMCNYRHYKISLFFLVQQFSSITSSILKQQITYAFIFPSNFTLRSIKGIYEAIGYGNFDTDKGFGNLIKNLTNGNKYTSLFYDSTVDEPNLRYQPFCA